MTSANGNTGNGTSNNTLTYIDLAGNTYDREVNALNDNITSDHQGGSLAGAPFLFPTFSKATSTLSGMARMPRPNLKLPNGT